MSHHLRKIVVVGIVALAVLLVPQTSVSAQVVACPAGYTCTPAQCPDGFICTPITPQPVNCPSGYICLPTSDPIDDGGSSGGGGSTGTTTSSCYVFNNDMTIGSRGIDVSALQTLLIANGFNIDGISSGAIQKGYFGQSTARAVMAYQRAHGLPATGFVGPLTRAVLNRNCNNGGGTIPTATNITVISPNGGETYSVGQLMNVRWTTGGGSGTEYVNLILRKTDTGSNFPVDSGNQALRVVNNGSYAWNIANIESGQYILRIVCEPVSGCPVANSRIFNIVSSNQPPTCPSGYVCPTPRPATEKGKAAYGFFQALLHRTPDVNIPDWNYFENYYGSIDQMRQEFLSGIEYTTKQKIYALFDQCGKPRPDDLQLTKWYYVSEYNGYTMDAVRSGIGCSITPPTINGISANVSASSPVNRIVAISDTAETNDVVLARFDVRSAGQNAELAYVNIGLNTSGASTYAIFKDVKLQAGGVTYSTNGISAVGASFTNMRIPLPADQNVSITIFGKIAQNTNNSLNGSKVYVTWAVNNNNLQVINGSYQSVSVVSTNLTSSVTTFAGAQSQTVSLSNTSGSLGAPVMSGNTTVAYPVSFNFTLTAGNSSIYVSSTASLVQSIASANVGLNYTNVVTSPNVLSGDGSGFYIIPAGTSRSFTLNGVTTNATSNQNSSGSVQISSIYYGTNTSNLQSSSITQGLENLKVNPVFTGSVVPPPLTPTLSLSVNDRGSLSPGSSLPITWQATGVSQVKIDVYDYKGMTLLRNITTVSASQGSYNWTIPSDLYSYNDDNIYVIRISDASNPSLYKNSTKITFDVDDISSTSSIWNALRSFIPR